MLNASDPTSPLCATAESIEAERSGMLPCKNARLVPLPTADSMRMSMDFAEGDRCVAEAIETMQATAWKTPRTMLQQLPTPKSTRNLISQ
jgi:hypothetical protein